MPSHPFFPDRQYPSESLFLREGINHLWFFRRHALALESQEGICYQEALMILITLLGRPGKFEPDPTKAWNEHIKADNLTSTLYGGALLLLEENYRLVNSMCVRYQVINPFFNVEQSIILGCEDYITSSNHWFGRMMTGSFVPQAVVQGCISMLRTIRIQHSHPESDGNLFHVPEMFDAEEEAFKQTPSVMAALIRICVDKAYNNHDGKDTADDQDPALAG